MATAVIYIVTSPSSSHIKIGFSSISFPALWKRYQTTFGTQMTFYTYDIANDITIETELHKDLRVYRAEGKELYHNTYLEVCRLHCRTSFGEETERTSPKEIDAKVSMDTDPDSLDSTYFELQMAKGELTYLREGKGSKAKQKRMARMAGLKAQVKLYIEIGDQVKWRNTLIKVSVLQEFINRDIGDTENRGQLAELKLQQRTQEERGKMLRERSRKHKKEKELESRELRECMKLGGTIIKAIANMVQK
jgi:hypothetical protein